MENDWYESRHKHRSERRRDRDREDRHRRSRHSRRRDSRDRSDSYDRYYRDERRDRSRHHSHSRRHHSRSRHNKKEIDINKFYEERRKARERSRSNSALRVMKMKNLENACGYFQRTYQRPHEDNDPSKPQLYWDGYQWVIRPSGIGSFIQDPIKPGRKVQIANVPLQLNLQVQLFKDYIIKQMIEKNVISRRDTQNVNNTIKAIEFNKDNNTAVLVMESVELAKQMILLDGLVLLGHTLRVSPFKEVNSNEVSLNNINKEAALANSAHLSAKSAAISYAAFQSILNNKKEVTLNISNNASIPSQSSRIVKVMNAVDPSSSTVNYGEVEDDIKDELSKFGDIVSCKIIRKGKDKLGAEHGAVFVEFQDVHSAEICIASMKGRQYEGREVRVAYIDENVYRKEILDN